MEWQKVSFLFSSTFDWKPLGAVQEAQTHRARQKEYVKRFPTTRQGHNSFGFFSLDLLDYPIDKSNSVFSSNY